MQDRAGVNTGPRSTRSCGRRIVQGISTLLALASLSSPLDAGATTGWLEREQLTGDWGGWRSRLADRGLVAGARYTAGFWSNVSGGLQTGTLYEGFAQWWLESDLEAVFGWRGASFQIDWYSYHGGQPTSDRVGAFPTQTVSGWETSTSVRFHEILLRQSFADGRFVLKAGQLAADRDFFVSEQAGELLNGSFGFFGLGRARMVSPFYPLAAPGAYFLGRSRDSRWEARVGVYTADPGEDLPGNFGFGWSFDNGAFLIGELRTRQSPFGRPGSYAIGVSGTTAELDVFGTGMPVEGAYGFYALIDQPLWGATDGRPGLGLFLRAYGTPQGDRSPTSWYVDAGLRVPRPLPGRSRDVLAVGFAYLALSDDFVDGLLADGLEASRRETLLELTYRCQATGWLTLQPNLQLFFDPTFSRNDAVVIGLRAVIEL